MGGTVTVTGTVTVNNPDTGNKLHDQHARPPRRRAANCPAGGTDPACTATVTVLIPGLTITNTPDTSVTTPGSVVGYTVTIADTGQTPYTGITVAESFAQTADDARLRRRRVGHHRHGVVRQPGADLDRQPERRAARRRSRSRSR